MAYPRLSFSLLFSAAWLNEKGEAYYTVELIYQSTDQLRGLTPLSLENPPMRYSLSFEGVEVNEDGMIAEADLLALLDRAIDAYDALEEQYGVEGLDSAA